MKNSKIKAAIFDLDGTLVDAFDAHLKAFNKAAKRLNLPRMSRKFLQKYNGQTGLEIIRQFLKKPYIDNLVEEAAVLKREIFASAGGSEIVALPGATKLISEFHRRKMPMAVASSARRNEIDFSLKKIGVIDKVNAIVSANDVKNSKPHPEIFLKAAEKLKVAPRDCVVFEDSPWGVLAAKRAGMKVVAVATGTTSKRDLKKLKPDMVLSTMKEILPPNLDRVLERI